MRWVVGLGCLAGCFSPAPPEGAPCGEGLRPCPAGQMCNPDDNRCYKDPQPGIDGNMPPSDSTNGGDGAPLTCTPRRLLTGGMDVTQQGWAIERVGNGTITYEPARTTFTTKDNARQLIVLRDAYPSDRWAITVVGEIVQSGGCTEGNAAVALMPSFHAPIGDANDRAKMLCASETAVMWGDNTVSIGVGLKTTGTVRLERTGATTIRATVQGSGQGTISGGPFTSNGTIAIGDQSTDLGLDSTFKIISVDLMCP